MKNQEYQEELDVAHIGARVVGTIFVLFLFAYFAVMFVLLTK